MYCFTALRCASFAFAFQGVETGLMAAGKKHWRVYEPVNGIALPSYSSGDLLRTSIGKPALEVTLEPGDVLYLPRGFVHEAVAAHDAASSHLTVSTYQQWSWYHLLQSVMERTHSVRTPLLLLESITPLCINVIAHVNISMSNLSTKHIAVTYTGSTASEHVPQ